MGSQLIPSHLQLLLIVIIFIFPISLCQYDARFSNCSRTFNCGTVTGIGYPFWGNDRADYCGHPGFELECQGNTDTVININSTDYHVLDINNATKVLTIARLDLLSDGICLQENHNTTLNFTLFQYASRSTNLTLFYGCSTTLNFPNTATCNGSDNDPAKVYFSLEPVQGGVTVVCQTRFDVQVLLTAAQGLLTNPTSLRAVIDEGFEVEWLVDDGFCTDCRQSGGECGYNRTSTQTTCFCFDKPYDRVCPVAAPPPDTTPPSTGRKLSLGGKLIIGFSTLGAGIMMIIIVIFCCFKRKLSSHYSLVFWEKRTNEDRAVETFFRNYGSLNPKRYSYSDIKKITNSFKEKLGQGGYGSVYKGKLLDSQMVAVKVLSEFKGNGEEFVNEVASISRTSHVNVVTLQGFCFEGRKRALIYEFMPNGSLEKFIYDKKLLKTNPSLGWERLYKIAIGIARGLEYLHRGCNTRILHFDIKPHNILLDQEFCPKISDFGLAKLCPNKESFVSMLAARGTIGYIAPEVFSRNFGGVSHKSDVYSYGMMLLEMVGGRKNIDVGVDHTSEIYFPHWIYKRLKLDENLGLHGLVTGVEEEIARKMTLVGLWCIQTDPLNRPSMDKVLEMLEGSLNSLQVPPKPYLSSPARSPVGSSNAA